MHISFWILKSEKFIFFHSSPGVNTNNLQPSSLTLAGQRWSQHPTLWPDLDLPIFSSYKWSEKEIKRAGIRCGINSQNRYIKYDFLWFVHVKHFSSEPLHARQTYYNKYGDCCPGRSTILKKILANLDSEELSKNIKIILSERIKVNARLNQSG